MNRDKIAAKYVEAWNNRDLDALLALFHPQASYHNAFWAETCSGSDLEKYFEASLAEDRGWYAQNGELLPTANGFVLRYFIYDQDDPDRKAPLSTGVEIITLSHDLIMTVSDYYCESDPTYLVEAAALTEALHGSLNVVPMGLSTRTSVRIRRRLTELANEMTVFLDPSLTVTRLADHISCSVMHLFHVLEEEKNTTFNQFVGECRARFASTLLVDQPARSISLARVADLSGFESIADLDHAFETTFNVSIDEYVRQFAKAQTSR